MTDRGAGGRRWLGLVAVALGVAMIVVDTTIVNVITPSVIDDLHIDSTQAQWVQESYAISFAALLLVFGRAADILGARRVFTAGVLVFGATSLLAGVAPSGGVLVAARFAQGAGGAMLLPTSLSLLNQAFSGRERGQAFAIWGSTIGAASAVGPVVGGWLAGHASWRWAFGINIPLVVVIFVLTLAFIDPSPRVRGRIDVASSVLSVLGLAALSFGLIEGRTYGWITSASAFTLFGLKWDSGLSPAFVALEGAVALLAMFTWWQARLSRDGARGQPLMDTRLFAIASFRNGNVATMIIGLGQFGIIAVVPLWLQFALGYTSLQAGFALLPLAGGAFFASALSFGLAKRLSALALVRIGLVVEAAGIAALGAVAAATSASWWAISLPLFTYGVGVGFATAQVTNVVLADVPPAEAGQGSGIQSTFRQLGSALGIATLTTIFYSLLGSGVRTRLKGEHLAPGQVDRYTAAVTDSAGAVIGAFARSPATAGAARAARDAMADGIAASSYAAAGLLAVGLLTTLLIPRAAPAARDRDRPVRLDEALDLGPAVAEARPVPRPRPARHYQGRHRAGQQGQVPAGPGPAG
ncbi:MAG TPA: DHA2 family efflux MFS transporter permease subunit [Trebonia sp.]|nr:DHA2 family efflux MFS transporter permease subunit [Trebonia sp.]